MKKLRTAIVVLLTLAIVGTAFAAVETLPGSGWWTSVGIQNPGLSAATVQLTAYHVNGGAADTHSASFSMPAGGSVTFLPGAVPSASVVDVTPPLEAGFQGSMVASSDQPLVAIGQVGNNVVGGLGVLGGYASAQYRASNQGATSLTYPTVKNNFNGKTTTFYIQAAGADTTVNATIITADGASHTAVMAVAANKTWVASPGDFTPVVASSGCGAAATSPCLGALSATTSGGEIVGAVVEHQAATSPATIAQSTSLFVPSDADTTVFCPTFKNAYGGGSAPRNTGITVQNTSGSAATVYLTLKTPSGTAYTSNAVVQSLSAVTFYPSSNNIGGFPSGNGGTAAGLGAATITSTALLIANVNEANTVGTPLKATTYSCFGAAGATAKIALPQVKEAFTGNNTGVSIQNTDVAANATVNAVYTCGGVAYTHFAKTLLPGASYTYYLESSSASNWTGTALTTNKLCAVTVTSSGGQKIVGIAQEAAYPSGNLDTKNYEGFNLVP